MSIPIKRLSPFHANTPASGFKNERHMQRSLAENLAVIEPGLRLFTDHGLSGVEVPCRVTDWGRQGAIDILANDAHNAIVVIECKIKYGDAMAFGQVLGYIAWIKRRLYALGDDDAAQKVRGIIVCRRANPILRILLSEFPAPVTVYEYQDATTLTRIG